MNRFLSSSKLASADSGIAFIRIITGAFLLYHGWEVFDAGKIKEYAGWDSFKGFSYPLLMAYLGKGSEFVAGLLLTTGFLTRIGCIIVICTLGYITFFIGHGEIWMNDQHPFMFVLLALVFIFTGPGKWSLDGLLFKPGSK